MKVIHSARQLQSAILKLKKQGKTVGLVPTMGALHEGHLSLVKRARRDNDIVIVSIFVNPTQFGPNEDYLRYPRPFEKDSALCRAAGVDFIFAPAVEDMYPDGYLTYVTVEKMSDVMCGHFRPGHFRGVATVVSKLFNIAQPDRAYFGKKDFQQLKVLERMVKDLNIPVKIVPCPIVRERSGLALSSRNQYLSVEQKEQSLLLSQSLQAARDLVQCHKIKNRRKIIEKVTGMINRIPGAKIDYIEVCDPSTLVPADTIRQPVLIAVAVWVGKTRLIDNIEIN